MKKYTYVLLAFTLFIVLLGFNATSVNALVSGCSSTSGFSSTTGDSCTTPAVVLPVTQPVSTCTSSGVDSVTNFLCGCNSTSGWSSTTGKSCTGCDSTSGYNLLTGQSCAPAPIPTPAPVCTNGFNSTNGFRCGCGSSTGYSSITGEFCGTTSMATTMPTVTISPASVSLGIQSGASTFTYPASIKDRWLTLTITPNQAVSYTAIPSANWLNVNSPGTTESGGGTAIGLTPQGLNLTPGIYTGTITFSPSGSSNFVPQTVTVTLNVTAVNTPISTCSTSGFDSTTGFRCGCTSTTGYSSTTGESCGTTPIATPTPTPILPITPVCTNGFNSTNGFRCGCNSTLGFSFVNGESCSVEIFPSGCSSKLGYSTTTGDSCGENTNTVLTPTTPVTQSSACTITSTLRIGSTGPDVSCLQLRIGLISDGKFGPRTQIAVKAFQANAGLKADGVVGPMSIAALEVAN